MGSLSVFFFRSTAVAILFVCSTSAVAHAQGAPQPPQVRRPCWDPQTASTATRIEDCTRVIETRGASEYDLWMAYQNRGMAYFMSANPDHERAIADFNEAARIAPSPTVLVHRGRIYTAQQNYPAAMADFNAAIASEADFAPAYYRRGIAYTEQSQFALAIADMDHATELAPDNYAYHYGRCRSRLVANVELDVARSACDEAVRLNPDPLSSLMMRGMVGLKQARWQDAWNDFDRILRSDPQSARAMYGRGVAAFGLGNTDDARREIARARQMEAVVVDDFAYFGVSPPSLVN